MRAAALVLVSAAVAVGCSPGAPGNAPPAWHVVLSNLDATLLCVWGSAPDSVFTVGGPLGNGSP